MNIEFSFTAFDDFPPLPQAKSKQLLPTLQPLCSNQGLSLVYSSLCKMAALDSYNLTKNLHKSLSDRIQTYPHTKQVLIHLFDNIASAEYLLQDRARNEASFTTDVRGFSPQKSPINPSCPISQTLSCPIPLTLLPTLMPKHNFTVLDHEKLFVDNYIYYCSLHRSTYSGVIPILVYIPHNVQDLNQAAEFVLDLCQAVRTILIS